MKKGMPHTSILRTKRNMVLSFPFSGADRFSCDEGEMRVDDALSLPLKWRMRPLLRELVEESLRIIIKLSE